MTPSPGLSLTYLILIGLSLEDGGSEVHTPLTLGIILLTKIIVVSLVRYIISRVFTSYNGKKIKTITKKTKEVCFFGGGVPVCSLFFNVFITQ